MGNNTLPASKVRLNLEVTAELDNLLKNLATKTGGTKTDMIRKGIALMKIALEAQEKGYRLGIVNEDDHLIKEIIGLY